MESIYTLLFILQVIVAIALIAFVLIQHGKCADAGDAFGRGSSSAVFGCLGSGSFLAKVATFLAIVVLANSLLLAYLASQSLRDVPESLLDTTPVVEQNETSTELQIPDEEYGDDQDIPKLPVE